MPYENMLGILARGIQTKPTWDYIDSRLNALRSLGMEQDISMAPQRLAMEQERLGIAREDIGIRKEDLKIRQTEEGRKEKETKLKEELLPSKIYMDYRKNLDEVLPGATYDRWDDLFDSITPSSIKKKDPIPKKKDIMDMAQDMGVSSMSDFNNWFETKFKPMYYTTQTKKAMAEIQKNSWVGIGAGGSFNPATNEVVSPISNKEQLPISDIGKLRFDRERMLASGVPPNHPDIKAIDDEIARKGKPEAKPVNMPPWYDTLGVSVMKDKYNTPEGRAEFDRWYAYPKNKPEIEKYLSWITRYTAPPMFSQGGIQNQEEMAFNARTGKYERTGQPALFKPHIQPLPDRVEDKITGALDQIRLLDEVESVADIAIGISGLGEIAVWAQSKLGSDKAQRFKANLQQLKIGAQSIIKGIPSNFDVQTFINSLPKESDTPKEARNKIKTARKILEVAIITGIANYDKSYFIPQYLKDRVNEYNIRGSLKRGKEGKPNTIGRFKIEEE